MSRPTFGYHCSHEQHPPSALLRYALHASDAGFLAAMCSDHFHPWSVRQGQSGDAWSGLGAALEATTMSFGTVCAPGQRYHPAVVAQAAATLGEMYGERFWLAVGSGEALNESITGEPWPDKDTRDERLEQSVTVMRALWHGETVSTTGTIRVQHAQLFTAPPAPVPVFAAALSPETARWAARWADGLITVAGPFDAMRTVVDAFREGGGEGKPMFLQAALSFAPTQAEAEASAYDQWRHCTVSSDDLADLPTPQDFDRASAGADRATVLSMIRASNDMAQHAAWLHEAAALGFTRIYLHNVAREHQLQFIDACATHLLP